MIALPPTHHSTRTITHTGSSTCERQPSDQRIAWSLRYVEGYALGEVASACGCSLATAKRKIAAAQHKVRALVTIEEDDLE